MKIAMLTSDYLPNIGGIASHIYELSKALIANGNEVEVWVWDRKGVNLDPLGMGDIPIRILSGLESERKRGLGFAKLLAQAVDSCLGEFKADVLHLHTLDPLMLSMRYISSEFSGKKVWTNHSSRFLRKVGSFVWRHKMRFYCRPFDGLLAPSKELLDSSVSMGFPAKKCLYTPNGVDVEKFQEIDKSEAKKKIGLPPDKLILLSTRRFSPKNGIRFLTMAMADLIKEIPEVICVFCGNMPDAKDWPSVQQIVKDKNLENFVRFEGTIPNNEINTYLSASDIVILPSLIEATSISGLEAMAVGRPLVGTRVGGIPELIDEGKTGFLVDPGDSRALANGIIRAYKELDFSECGRRAREKVFANYTWTHVAKTVSDFYQNV